MNSGGFLQSTTHYSDNRYWVNKYYDSKWAWYMHFKSDQLNIDYQTGFVERSFGYFIHPVANPRPW